MSDNKFGLGAVQEKIRIMKDELPVALVNQARNYFVDSWAKQGWDGQPWKEVERREPGTKAYKYSKPAARTRAILVQSGALRRAVTNSVRTIKFDQSRLIVDLPYAAAHNDGNEHLPARTFMKDSLILRVQQQQKINQFVNNIWKK